MPPPKEGHPSIWLSPQVDLQQAQKGFQGQTGESYFSAFLHGTIPANVGLSDVCTKTVDLDYLPFAAKSRTQVAALAS